MEYQLRAAAAADFEFLYRLHIKTTKEHVARTWGWDEADQARRFHDGCHLALCRIVVIAGEDVGMIGYADCGDRARRLFERLGFQVTGETETHWMIRYLPSAADEQLTVRGINVTADRYRLDVISCSCGTPR